MMFSDRLLKCDDKSIMLLCGAAYRRRDVTMCFNNQNG